MTELDDWIAAASAELGLQPTDVSATAVLDVARDVAHQVMRPGAPLTAYLMGLAVGRGAQPADVTQRITDLASAWASRSGAPSSSASVGAAAAFGPGRADSGGAPAVAEPLIP